MIFNFVVIKINICRNYSFPIEALPLNSLVGNLSSDPVGNENEREEGECDSCPLTLDLDC